MGNSFGFGKEYELNFAGESYSGEASPNMTIREILEEHNLVRSDSNLDKDYDIRVDNIKRSSTFKFDANYEGDNPIISITPKTVAGN